MPLRMIKRVTETIGPVETAWKLSRAARSALRAPAA